MSELQATIEFSVELNKFYNVDLFQRGYYQIRTALKSPPKVPSKTEITLQKSAAEVNFPPAHVVNEVAVSRTFHILYRNEDLAINDVVLYRFHSLIESTRLEEELKNLEIYLTLELWFTEEENGCPDISSSAGEKMECVSQRTLQLHFNPTKGLHHFVPILFDYFHLCAVEVMIHGTLIALHQPFLSVPRQPKSAWSARNPEYSTLETIYFGIRPISGDPARCSLINLHQAWQIHHRICNMLLSAYESLQAYFEMYLRDHLTSRFKIEHVDCHRKLQKVMGNIQDLDNEEELIQNSTRDITQLCAGNVILWTQFLEVVTLDESLLAYLAKEHHTARIKRFAEAFFTHDYPKNECLSCYEPSYHGHSDFATVVRASNYLHSLPPLIVECLELDGDHTTLPIIFEDIYMDHKASVVDMTVKLGPKSSPISKPKAQNSPASQMKPKKNFIKNIKPDSFKRPSYSCVEAESQKNHPNDVVLVGYRQKMSRIEVNPTKNLRLIELGTLSPCPSSDGDEVPSAGRRRSTESLPEYVKVARRSLREKKRNAKSSIITADFGGSNPDFQTGRALEHKTRGKFQRSNTDPISSLTVSTQESVIEGVKSLPSYSETSTLSGSTEYNNLKDRTNTGLSDSSATSMESGSIKKHLDFEDDLYKNLTKCLSDALGEDNDDDHSDDDSNVQNGYDEFFEDSYRKNNSDVLSPFSGKSPSSDTAPSVDVGKTKKTKQGLTVADIVTKSDIDIKLSTSKGKRGDSVHFSMTSESAENNSGSLSTHAGDLDTDLNRHLRRDRSGSSPNLQAPSPVTGSLASLSKDSGIITHGSDDQSDSDQEEVTVIQLLKEEYQKSIQRMDAGTEDSMLHNLGITKLVVSHNYHKASSDSNILKSVDYQDVQSDQRVSRSSEVIASSSSYPDLTKCSTSSPPKLVSDQVCHNTVNFVKMREDLKKKLKYQGHLYSEYPTMASTSPYFLLPEAGEEDTLDGCHLIICCHGLDGNSADLRLVKTYLEIALPGYRLEFLMSESNQQDTFADFDTMTDRLVSEILTHIDLYALNVVRVSFVGHSLGNLIIRSALSRSELAHLIPKMHTMLSLSGPHLGTLYNNSGLVNMGMWFMQKWKKSGSLLQLSLKDHHDPRQTFLFKLSQRPGLEFFKNVLLVGSSQDRYVPYHSSRIEMCKAAQRDVSGLGSVYAEMVANILTPIVNNPQCKLIRYDVFHALPSTANTIIGRAAHIAVLDSEIFIEKFFMVTGLKYFK